MTKFTKANLHKDGPYVFYAEPENRWNHKKHIHIARFKTAGAGTFMTHLRKHWTLEKWLAAKEEGLAPLEIVKQTGYLLPHIKRWLKADGYPQTQAGYAQWRAAQAAA